MTPHQEQELRSRERYQMIEEEPTGHTLIPTRSINDIGTYNDFHWYHRDKLYRTLFFTDTREGWLIEVCVLAGIVLSTLSVFLDSIGSFRGIFLQALRTIQWVWTIFTAIEYLIRLYAAKDMRRYALSFYGIGDLIAFLPSLLFASAWGGTHYTLIFRMLRLLRVFRVFHLGEFMQEGRIVAKALRQSSTRIVIFILWIVVIVCVLGTVMFLVEGQMNPMFSSIPRAIYWAIITLTTVGYGDITPITAPGQIISTVVMLLGYAIIAVPTGIVTAEVSRMTGSSSAEGVARPKVEISLSDLSKLRGANQRSESIKKKQTGIYCYSCGHHNIDGTAIYCNHCGTKLYKGATNDKE